MNVPLPLWIALILLSCYGDVRSYVLEEGEENTTYYDPMSVTPTPDYDYDYNATFDYYYVNASEIIKISQTEQGNSVRRISPVDRSLIIGTLMVSLAALLH